MSSLGGIRGVFHLWGRLAVTLPQPSFRLLDPPPKPPPLSRILGKALKAHIVRRERGGGAATGGGGVETIISLSSSPNEITRISREHLD